MFHVERRRLWIESIATWLWDNILSTQFFTELGWFVCNALIVLVIGFFVIVVIAGFMFEFVFPFCCFVYDTVSGWLARREVRHASANDDPGPL